jgi:hypothetical protein
VALKDAQQKLSLNLGAPGPIYAISELFIKENMKKI